VVGALLGIQRGFEVELITSFELALAATSNDDDDGLDMAFLTSQLEQCLCHLGVRRWFTRSQTGVFRI
jgi:hypothetical protein